MKKKIRAEKPLPKNRPSKRVGTGAGFGVCVEIAAQCYGYVACAQLARKDRAVKELAEDLRASREMQKLLRARELLQHMLDVAENADETGYVTDVGFVDLDKLHEEVRACLSPNTKVRHARANNGEAPSVPHTTENP